MDERTDGDVVVAWEEERKKKKNSPAEDDLATFLKPLRTKKNAYVWITYVLLHIYLLQ